MLTTRTSRTRASLAAIAACGLLGATSVDAEVIIQQSGSGDIKFEAGSYDALTNPGTSLITDNSDGTLTTTTQGDDSSLVTYKIQFATAGSYYLYFDVTETGSTADSVYVNHSSGFDSTPGTVDTAWNSLQTGWNALVGDGNGGTGVSDDTTSYDIAPGTPAYAWTVASPGTVSFTVRNREDGIVWKNFVFSSANNLSATALNNLPLSTTSADKPIKVENSAGFVVGGPTSNERTQAFAAGADADMLIVSAGGDTRTVLTVSYDGVAMTPIPGTKNGSRVSGIWYLANPSASGDIVFTLSGTTGTPQDFALAAASISSRDGNPIAVGAADTASGTSLSLTVPEDDSFVFVAVGANDNGSATASVPPLDQRMAIGTISSMKADAGWDNGVAAGTSPSYAFTITGTVNSPVISAASFHVTSGVTPDPKITSITVTGDTVELQITGDDGTGYYCASSTDLSGFTTEEAVFADSGLTTPIASPFNTSGGSLTFYVDVTGDPRLFFRIQDTDPDPSP